MDRKIKKIAMLFFVAATVISFGACGEKEEGNEQPDKHTLELFR